MAALEALNSFVALALDPPFLKLSNDDLPLAVTVKDLVAPSLGGTFPEARSLESPISWWLQPVAPIAMVGMYLLSKPLLKAACKQLGITGTSTFFRMLVALHNLVLVVFSGLVAYKSWPLVLGHAQTYGWRAAYCDADFSMWNGANFGFWATVFYLSKYYEFIDTWVLIAKGKEPSLLQVYHHAGIAITMWGSTVAQGSWIAWVVCMNSTVHTLMYTYFLLSTFGIKLPGAKYLTTMQIIQFIVGITGTLYVQVLGAECQSDASRLVLAVIQTYALGLIGLFSAFFMKKYKKKEKKEE